MEINTPQEVFESLKDAVITGGDVNDDGLHVYLSDGRVLMFVGDFLVYVGVTNKSALQ